MRMNNKIQNVLENILERPLCDKCREERKRYKKYDQKKQGFYSNILVGFASKPIAKLNPPIDVMVLAESHGGGNYRKWKDLQSSKLSLENAMRFLEEYYRTKPLKKFHQSCIKKLLNELDQRKYAWFFTDVVKCFVAKTDGNFKSAIEKCKEYLHQQISVLDPRVIIALGNVAWRTLGLPLERKAVECHGKIKLREILGRKRGIIYSVFPSQSTADKWIEAGEEPPVLKKIEVFLKR